MSISISNATAAATYTATNASSTAAGAQAARPAASTEAYVVKLSEAQQVSQLYQQGQQVSQIASNLSLPVQTVNSYLGISNNK